MTKLSLTVKKEVFAQVLAASDDQAKAYRAMLPDSKASNKSVWQAASKLSKNVKVISRVKELKSQIKQRAEEKFNINQDRVLLEIARLAFNDPRKAFDRNGNLKKIQDWPDEVAAAISSIKITEQRSDDDELRTQLKEIKFWDKGKQLELATKTLGMIVDKFNVDVKVNPIEELMKEIEGSALRPKSIDGN